jgi:cell filamentation protein
VDSYLIPGTSTLRNKLGITDPYELAVAEAEFTAARLFELSEYALEGHYDRTHLQAFHRHIFGEIYDWAGDFRTTYLAKRDSVTGYLSRFTEPKNLEKATDAACKRMTLPEDRNASDRTSFALLLAEGCADFIDVHPFRDGNGRTVRAFLTQFARAAGYDLSFDFIGRERWTRASVEAHTGQRAAIHRIFIEATDPVAIERFQSIASALMAKTQDGSFNLDEQYVAVPRPGQEISGIVAMLTDDVALIISPEGRLELASTAAFEQVPIVGDEVRYREPQKDQDPTAYGRNEKSYKLDPSEDDELGLSL